MFGQPRILVCTDFSESSDRALSTARDFSQKSKGEIHLLHVADIGHYLELCGYANPNPEFNADVKEQISRELTTKMNLQLKRCEAEGTKHLVFEGNAVGNIRKLAAELNADLIVVGHKGATNEKHFSLGSLTRKLAMASEVPVLIVKSTEKVEKIAALFDGEEECRRVMDIGIEMSYLFSSGFSVISLLPAFPGVFSLHSPEFSSALLNTFHKRTEEGVEQIRNIIVDHLKGRNADLIVQASNERDTGKHLVEILNDEKINLAVLKKHNRPAFERFLLGSVSANVLELYDGNILIF